MRGEVGRAKVVGHVSQCRQGQAEHVSKSKNKLLATTYKPFSRSLYIGVRIPQRRYHGAVSRASLLLAHSLVFYDETYETVCAEIFHLESIHCIQILALMELTLPWDKVGATLWLNGPL